MTALNMSDLALHAEELESLDAQWSWGDFFIGVGVGLTLISIGVAIT